MLVVLLFDLAGLIARICPATERFRWQTVPVIPIIGARKQSQLQDNLASLDMGLSAEQLKSLDGASRIEPGFPQSICGREMVRAIRYGGTWDRLLL
jgi:diketogulonate reductase-like aldo/keto reductase